MSTIKDVAKLAGVSPSTVSRTLSNRIFVEEETRQKVLKAVEELGYHPNIIARGLKEGKTNILGFMVPDINSLFYPMIMKAVERYASQKGYSLILINNDESLEKEKQALWSFAGRRVDGILCMSVEDEIGHLTSFQEEQKVPVVLVNRSAGSSMSSVSTDNEYGGYLMTKYLLDHGHTRISGMFGDLGKDRFRTRYKGYLSAMEEYGIQDYEKYVIYDVNSVEEAYQRTCEILKGADRPTAFFASMDILAIGIYSGINACGLRIPDDISVVGFDNIFMAQYMIPGLTTYNFSVDSIAEICVDLLLKEIDEPGCGKEHITQKGSLLERGSVKRI